MVITHTLTKPAQYPTTGQTRNDTAFLTLSKHSLLSRLSLRRNAAVAHLGSEGSAGSAAGVAELAAYPLVGSDHSALKQLALRLLLRCSHTGRRTRSVLECAGLG